MGILLVISYKELGRDSDPNEDGTEGPDMILRMFKVSALIAGCWQGSVFRLVVCT